MLFKIALCLLSIMTSLTALTYEEPWGKDTDLIFKEPSTQTAYPSPSLATKAARQVILFHQKVISPVDGPRSHFKPCSSQYMKLAMMKHGFVKGFLMGCDRLLRENKDPWVYRNISIDGKLIKYDPPR
jgi:putative component of membrane protein insertase Oxa1/YidC/SpoIIIJ protein YidD